MSQANKLVSLSKVLLTYQQTGDLTKDELLGFLRGLDGYECCIITREEHHETEGFHLHVVLKFGSRRRCRHNAAMALFKFGDRTADVEFLKSAADVKRAVKYITKEDKEPLVDNMDLDAILNDKHTRKYDTKRLLETPVEQLVEEGTVSPYQMRNILWAQQWWQQHKAPGDKDQVRGVWLYGPSGCGKSTAARAYGAENGGYYLKDQNKWWDGYNGEGVVILDDLDTGALCHHLKIWADKFAFKGEIKGSTVWLNYDTFIVTSNHTIPEIVGMSLKSGEPYNNELERALTRRFHLITPDGNKEYMTKEDISDALTPPAPKQQPQDNPFAGFNGSGY